MAITSYKFGFENVTSAAITDDSGNGANGAAQGYTGTPTTGTSVVDTTGANHSKALNFNYTNSNRVEVPDSTATQFNAYTMMAWVYLDPSKGPTVTVNEGGARWEIMEKSTSFWFNIRQDTTPLYVVRAGGYYGASGTTTTVDSPAGIQPLTWTHVAVVWTGTNQITYINGAQVATVATPGVVAPSTENFVWGAKHKVVATPTYLEAFWNGMMDDIQFSNTAFTAQQVVSAMNQAIGITDTTAPSIPTNVQAVSASATQVSVTWTASTDDVGVDHYQVLRGGTPIGTTTGTSYQDSTVTTGQTYTYTVKAFDVAGNASNASTGSSVTVSGVVWVNISGATSQTYTDQAADVGKLLRCIGTATNTAGTVTYQTPPTAIVTNITGTPINTAVPTLTPLTGVTTGTALTGAMGTWTGALSWTVKFQRVSGTTVTDISSKLVTALASQTYTSATADVNSTIQFTVIANANADGSGAQTSKTTAATNSITLAGAARSYPPIPQNPQISGFPAKTPLPFPSTTPTTSGTGPNDDARAVKCAAAWGTQIFVGGVWATMVDETGANVAGCPALFSATLTLQASGPNAGVATGGVLTAWRPSPNGNIEAMHVSGDGYLYVGGGFSQISGVAHDHIARYKLTAGAVPTIDATFTPATTVGNISAIVVSPDNATLYVGGGSGLQAIKISDGSNITTFAPNLTLGAEGVREVGFAPGTTGPLYVAADMSKIGTRAQFGACSVNEATGAATSWVPDIGTTETNAKGHDLAFMPDGSAIFIAIAGLESGGNDGDTTKRFELLPTPANTNTWRSVADGDNNAVATNGQYVVVGHHGDGNQVGSGADQIQNVGCQKIMVIDAGTGLGLGGQNVPSVKGGGGPFTNVHVSLWFPSTSGTPGQAGGQFNGVRGSYAFVFTDKVLICCGGWSLPASGVAVFAAPVTGIV